VSGALRGKRVLVTRPRAQAEGLVERLAELGAEPVVFPTIAIAPLEDTSQLDQAIRKLTTYRWVIFTSANGVAAFWSRLAVLGYDKRRFSAVKVAAIGPATTAALVEHGVKPDFVPAEFVAEAIVPGLGEVSGQRILLPRAEIARKALVDELRRLGAQPDEIAVYRTIHPQPSPAALAELEAGVDVATFTSSSTVRGFFELLGAQRAAAVLKGAIIACIGPITAETAQEYGLAVTVVAAEYSMEGLVRAIEAYFQYA
jgi:uroporphyrinogen III methyltransferase / synthase